MLNPERLAELGSDFTVECITERVPSQVTVLKMKQMAAGEGGHPDCCLGRTPRDPACRLTAKATRAGADWLRQSGWQLAG